MVVVFTMVILISKVINDSLLQNCFIIHMVVLIFIKWSTPGYLTLSLSLYTTYGSNFYKVIDARLPNTEFIII